MSSDFVVRLLLSEPGHYIQVLKLHSEVINDLENEKNQFFPCSIYCNAVKLGL